MDSQLDFLYCIPKTYRLESNFFCWRCSLLTKLNFVTRLPNYIICPEVKVGVRILTLRLNILKNASSVWHSVYCLGFGLFVHCNKNCCFPLVIFIRKTNKPTHIKIILFRLCCVPTSLSGSPANSGLTCISQTHKADRLVTFYFKGEEQLRRAGSNNQGHGDEESITLESHPSSVADPYTLKTGSGSRSPVLWWPQSKHRVATAAFWRTFHHGGKISPGGEGGVCTPTPFSSSITYKVAMNAPAERADTLTLFHLYPFVLCGDD